MSEEVAPHHCNPKTSKTYFTIHNYDDGFIPKVIPFVPKFSFEPNHN